jgi:uncharacterized glyoxalase superfamily protein PhnB
MTITAVKPQLASIAPQFLVDDLDGAIAYYRDVLGFAFGEPWGGFYAIGERDGVEIHLKEAPKNADERTHRHANEHLDAYVRVKGIDTFYAQCVAKGANIIKPLAEMPWGTKDFFLADPEGYIIAFGEVIHST